MTKYIMRLSLLITILGGINSLLSKDATGKSFLSVWPAFQINSPERLCMRHNQMKLYDDQRRHEFDVTALGGKSTDSQKTAKYFGPFDERCLRMGEFGTDWAKTGNVDLVANYFNVFTDDYPVQGDALDPTIDKYTFKSQISFTPEYKFYGVGLHYRYQVSCDPEKGFWLDVAVPILHVETNMNLKEGVIKPGGATGENPNVPEGYFGNMTDAFKQSGWQFGKINGSQSITRVADIQLGVGYTYIKEETHYLQSYMGVIVATGNKPKGEFMFEPIAGNGGHNGIVFAMHLGFLVWGSPTQSIAMNLDTASTFFFHNNQVRSLDLKNNQWSRYMSVYKDKDALVTSDGINSFTREVRVGHGFVRNINAAVTYTHCNGMQIEGGYQFFAQSAESVELNCNWKTGPAIAALWKKDDAGNQVFITGTGNTVKPGISRDNATIRTYEYIDNDKVMIDDPVDGIIYVDGYRPITASDFDLESAATPGFVTHTFYLSFGKYWDHLYNPKFLGAGFSYEFCDENSGMNRWMLWGKIGITF